MRTPDSQLYAGLDSHACSGQPDHSSGFSRNPTRAPAEHHGDKPVGKRARAVFTALVCLWMLATSSSAMAQWVATTSLPVGRAQAATVADSSGKIHVMGGFDASNAVVTTHSVFDPATSA